MQLLLSFAEEPSSPAKSSRMSGRHERRQRNETLAVPPACSQGGCGKRQKPTRATNEGEKPMSERQKFVRPLGRGAFIYCANRTASQSSTIVIDR